MVESGGSEPEGSSADRLLPGQVEIWLLRTESAPAGCLDALRRLLSAEELERNARFRFSRDRDLHTFGRGLMRTLLSRQAARAPADWSIRPEPSGRPVIANPTGGIALDFSISHTPGLVAVALGRDVRVGVDVEGRHDLFDDPAVARAILNPAEERALAMAPPAERAERLRRLWVLKEAFGKALGTGIAEGIRDVAFAIDGVRSIRMTSAGPDRSVNADEWWFHEQSLDGDFRIALAVHAPGRSTEPPAIRSFDCGSDLPDRSGVPS